ncbi:hypothetical protein CYY_001348 [Polysphondylium violaceum]|uniref:Uncharacterized protein n=1 Tax=Polysphondylium violaceum TaxID=133409 RepID=A0A8J4Q174_9MYCE|nr:hypothetical protein CYY_001348 [Polysphondylium violaceum]
MKGITKILLACTFIVHLYWYNAIFPFVSYGEYSELSLGMTEDRDSITGHFSESNDPVVFSKLGAYGLSVALDKESIDNGVRLSNTYSFASKLTSLYYESYSTGLIYIHNNPSNHQQNYTLLVNVMYSDNYVVGRGVLVIIIFGSFLVSLILITIISYIVSCKKKQRKVE